MSKLTPEMREVAEKTDVFAVATASKDGKPNVVIIKFVKIISDDEFIVMDNYLLKTRKNVEDNPVVAATFWSGINSYQLKGAARIVTSGPVFEDGVAWVKSISPARNPKAVIIVKIDEIYIASPGADAGKRVA